MDPERALGIVHELEGVALDPEVVRVLEGLVEAGRIPDPGPRPISLESPEG